MKRFILVGLLISAICSCKEDEMPQAEAPDYPVIIANEGNFPDAVGSISLYDPETKQVEQDAYQKVNQEPLGSVVNSVLVDNGLAFFVINGTGSLVVADAQTLEKQHIFKNLKNPRHIAKAGPQKYYVSSWTENALYIIDVDSRSITGTIPTGVGPERMLFYRDWVLVVNSGGYTSDSSISIISTATDQSIGDVRVGENPNSLQIDKNNRLWVMCSGVPDYANPAKSSPGSIYIFDIDSVISQVAENRPVSPIKSWVFADPAKKPGNLQMADGGEYVFFLNDGITANLMKMEITADSLPDQPFVTGSFYSFKVAPERDELYLTDALGYTENGKVYRHKAQDGSLLDEFKAGIIPGDIGFR